MANTIEEHHEITCTEATEAYAEELINRGGTVEGFFIRGVHAALDGKLDDVVLMVQRLKGQDIDPESGWYLACTLMNACGPEEHLGRDAWPRFNKVLKTRAAENALMAFWLFCEAHRSAAAEY